MNYVLTESGNIKIGTKGHPLVTGADGKEHEINAIEAASRITELNTESAGHRKDAAKHLKSLETMTATNTDLQATVDSIGDDNKVEMDKFRNDTTAAWQEKLDVLQADNTTLKGKVFDRDVISKIRNSKLIETTVLPASVFVNTFKGQFQDDSSAKGWDGRVILSKENPSNNAGTTEALGVLLDTHPERDSLLKASGAHSGEHHRDDKSGTTTTAMGKIKSGLGKLTGV